MHSANVNLLLDASGLGVTSRINKHISCRHSDAIFLMHECVNRKNQAPLQERLQVTRGDLLGHYVFWHEKFNIAKSSGSNRFKQNGCVVPGSRRLGKVLQGMDFLDQLEDGYAIRTGSGLIFNKE